MHFLFESNLKSGVAIVPTAGGKALILAKMSVSISVPTLYIVPSIDLLYQNAQAIIEEGGDVGIYSGSLGKKEIKPLTIATISSLKDAEEFKKLGFKFLIVDEAHYKCSEDGMFMDFYKALKPKKLLGLTATAFKLKTQYGFYSLVMLDRIRPKIFQEIIHVTQVKDVIDAGRWSKIIYEVDGYNESGLRLNSNETDWLQESVIENNSKEQVNRKLVRRLKHIIQTEPTSKTLVFTDCVETASKIEEWINNGSFGVKCAIVTDSTTSKDRKTLVDAFKDVKSNVNVLINFGTFTTGLDCPPLKYVLLGRPTMSFALYYQILGRGVRIYPGKEYFTFIDFCGNVKRFGKIEDIVYKNVKGYGWTCFSGDRLMTGVPVYSNRKVTEQDLLNPPKLEHIDYKFKMPFGKYEGKPMIALPKHYRDYMLREFDFNATDTHVKLKQILISMQKNDFTNLLLKGKRDV